MVKEFLDKVTRTEKPWGYERILVQTPKFVVKEIFVNSDSELSLQYHVQKTETMFLIDGEGFLELHSEGLDENARKIKAIYHKELVKLTPHYIPAGQIHRLYTKNHHCVVLEVSSTELDDVVRLEDKYGRVKDENSIPERSDVSTIDGFRPLG